MIPDINGKLVKCIDILGNEVKIGDWILVNIPRDEDPTGLKLAVVTSFYKDELSPFAGEDNLESYRVEALRPVKDYVAIGCPAYKTYKWDRCYGSLVGVFEDVKKYSEIKSWMLKRWFIHHFNFFIVDPLRIPDLFKELHKEYLKESEK